MSLRIGDKVIIAAVGSRHRPHAINDANTGVIADLKWNMAKIETAHGIQWVELTRVHFKATQ